MQRQGGGGGAWGGNWMLSGNAIQKFSSSRNLLIDNKNAVPRYSEKSMESSHNKRCIDLIDSINKMFLLFPVNGLHIQRVLCWKVSGEKIHHLGFYLPDTRAGGFDTCAPEREFEMTIWSTLIFGFVDGQNFLNVRFFELFSTGASHLFQATHCRSGPAAWWSAGKTIKQSRGTKSHNKVSLCEYILVYFCIIWIISLNLCRGWLLRE